MAKVTVKITGLKEIDRALGRLPKATAKATLRKVLKEAGEPLAAEMRSLAPKFEHHLEENIDVGTRLTRRQRSLYRSEGGGQDFAEMFVGTANPAGVQQEFGTGPGHKAQPFARPAWDAQKDNVLKIITHRLWTAIEQAAARVAKKAAKGN